MALLIATVSFAMKNLIHYWLSNWQNTDVNFTHAELQIQKEITYKYYKFELLMQLTASMLYTVATVVVFVLYYR